MPDVMGMRDILTQPLYDTNAIANGATSATFFSTPLGQGGKTLLDTNMALAGQLQAGYGFDVWAIAVNFQNNVVLADLKAITDGGFGQFNVGSKWWWQSPLTLLPGGCGLAGVSDIGAAAATNLTYQNGMPDPRAIYTLRQPVRLQSTESFNFVMTFPTALTLTATTRTRVVLHGELTRTVQ